MTKNKDSELAQVCDVAYALGILGGKWKLSIIWELHYGPLRLSALRRRVVGISEGVLIVQLKELERDGLVLRTDYKTIPPHVEYSITPVGLELMPMLKKLEAWGDYHRRSR